jgi:TetR/AcrR family transcriptional regulator, regulator of cefoperazone and chloramphenicol sensitivity
MKVAPPSEGYKKSSGRRRPAAGYARGEETRLRIIRAAVELFGNQGFDRVSTRDIAARAGVNAPVLQYYFEGKEGLYLACIEYMQLHTTKLLRPVIDTVRKRLERKMTRDGLIDCVCYIYEQAADFLLTHSEIDSWKRFAAWDVLDRDRIPCSAHKALDMGIRREFRQLMCELVGRIIGKPPTDEQTRVRVLTLGSQLSCFHDARRKALDDLGWTEVNERGLQLLKAVVREQTAAALRAAAADMAKKS